MSFGKVDAGNGLTWLTEGIGLVFRNPAAFLLMALIVGVINLIPLLGGLAILICGPALTGGIAYAAREESEGRKAEFSQLFRAFQEPGKIGPMLMLCLPSVVGATLMLVCLVVVGLGTLVSGGLSAANGSSFDIGALGGSVMFLALIAIAVTLVTYALQFFAIPRVMFDGVEPFAAMKESFSACLANVGAFLVFGIVFCIAAFVISMVLMFIPVIGWIAIAGFAAVVMGCALFLAWRQVYGGVAAAMPPPAPEAPPPQP
jgi:uncharacterized membrane protein